MQDDLGKSDHPYAIDKVYLNNLQVSSETDKLTLIKIYMPLNSCKSTKPQVEKISRLDFTLSIKYYWYILFILW